MSVHIENPLFSEFRIAYSVLHKGRRDSHVSIALSARKSRFQTGFTLNAKSPVRESRLDAERCAGA